MHTPPLSRRQLSLLSQALLILAYSAGVDSQSLSAVPQTVQWQAIISAPSGLQPGQTATVELSGHISDGWHVYGLKQLPQGPTELRFSADDNPIAQSTSPPTGSQTIHNLDRGFGFEVQYYADSLKLSLPIQVKAQAPSGHQQIPVSVRFQSCSAQTCLPPATAHLLVDVDIRHHA